MNCLADIKIARDLLDKAEKNEEPIAKVGMLTKALEILEDCLDDEPTVDEQTKINNIKKSFARNLSSQIKKMNIDNFDTFLFYLTALIKLENEVKALREEDKEFDTSIKYHNEHFSEEIHLLTKCLK